MTQTGKCDTCRQRKVKCNEERPKCGACRTKDRACAYSYGKASAFVVQDPNQLTKHGKSKVAPVVYELDSPQSTETTTATTSSNLHTMTEREAENGQGVFKTLAPLSKNKIERSRKATAPQRRKLGIYLQNLQAERAIRSIRPSAPETTLIARYIDMLGPEQSDRQPMSILGTWVQSIPARIGSNTMMDLAVEFLIDSYALFWNDTFSKRRVARASKEKALKELQVVVLQANSQPTYDVLLATKMHYAAEALMGIDTMYHAIHAFGLAELLKSGAVANVDDEHYWNLIDNTYIDDVNEAMLAGRASVYDNDFYLSSTYPPSFSMDSIQLSAYQRASMAIMHIFIQCPRLNCLIRQAVTKPEDTEVLVAAVTLAESLWQLDLSEQVAPLLTSSITVLPVPPIQEVSDIVPMTLQFDSVQSMILCTRYWMLINLLAGLVDTLYRHFPTETGLSLLPNPEALRRTETDAAIQLAASLCWAQSVSRELPLVPLRLHTPLQISIGPWYRTIRRLTSHEYNNNMTALDPYTEAEHAHELSHARRMKTWLIEECNRIHRYWDVSLMLEKPLLEALNTMAGEKIPDWLPVRVRFEAEDGEMVMKLDYENKTGSFQKRFDLGDESPQRMKASDASIWADDAQLWQDMQGGSSDLAIGTGRNETYRNETMRPCDVANFVHSTGRNLCSTSGWWPSSETTTQSLLAGTPCLSTPSDFATQELATLVEEIDGNGNPCLASSFWPQTPNTPTISFNTSPKNVCLSPAWLSPRWLSPRPGSATTNENRKSSTANSSGWTSTGTTPSSDAQHIHECTLANSLAKFNAA